MIWEYYCFARTPAHALELLVENKGDARLIAGGTDLMFLLKDGSVKPKAMVDLGHVKELQEIQEANGFIKIGSMVTHKQLASSELICSKVRILAEAARSVGSPQIRNVGTIGGNVVSAQPAADTSIALLALGTKAFILTSQGEEEKPLQETFVGPGKSAINPAQELLTYFVFPSPGPSEATAFARHARRKALSLPILNVGIWLKMDDSRQVIEDIRIAMGPMAGVPFRALQTESYLKGKTFTPEAMQNALETAASEVNPRDSFRGGSQYKKEMVKVFLKRALVSAVEELRGENNG